MPNPLETHLAQLQKAKEALEAAGIDLRTIEKVPELIDTYRTLQDELKTARAEQFSDDALEILNRIYNKKRDMQGIIARILRQFAVHVATETLRLVEEGQADRKMLEDLVDQIPSMYTLPQE